MMENNAPSPEGADLVIQGGMLISMVEGEAPLPRANVLIKGDRIAGIDTAGKIDPREQEAPVIDARGGLIMPGLVNAHGHTAMTLFRGLADDLPLKQWLFEKIFPAEAKHLTPETVYWGALLGSMEMIASGTTTISDGYFYQDATVRAFHEAGLRSLTAQGIIDFPAPGVPDPKDNLKVGRDFIEQWRHFSTLITPGLFCHSPSTCSETTLREAMDLCQHFSLPLQIHLSETQEEVHVLARRTGLKPCLYLDRLGLLTERLVAVHAVHLDDEEIALLARRKVKIVHAPESNMKLSSGAARVSDMLKAGLTLGIGTDGCASNNDLDLFQEMDTAAKLDKVYTLNPVNMDARTVLKMATSGGAKILGLEKDIGTIEVGKKADIIVVDLNSPHLTPFYNPYSVLVYSASGSDVKDVIVDGKVLMKNRKLLTLDPDLIMNRVREISRNIAP
jgi:5-methylthioadenosine/S-adenosylhomocysteine deaminase